MMQKAQQQPQTKQDRQKKKKKLSMAMNLKGKLYSLSDFNANVAHRSFYS